MFIRPLVKPQLDVSELILPSHWHKHKVCFFILVPDVFSCLIWSIQGNFSSRKDLENWQHDPFFQKYYRLSSFGFYQQSFLMLSEGSEITSVYIWMCTWSSFTRVSPKFFSHFILFCNVEQEKYKFLPIMLWGMLSWNSSETCLNICWQSRDCLNVCVSISHTSHCNYNHLLKTLTWKKKYFQ